MTLVQYLENTDGNEYTIASIVVATDDVKALVAFLGANYTLKPNERFSYSKIDFVEGHMDLLSYLKGII